MKYTLCPPGPEPKRITASCPQIGKMLKGGDDLTINQRREAALYRPDSRTPIEDRLRALIEDTLRNRNGDGK